MMDEKGKILFIKEEFYMNSFNQPYGNPNFVPNNYLAELEKKKRKKKLAGNILSLLSLFFFLVSIVSFTIVVIYEEQDISSYSYVLEAIISVLSFISCMFPINGLVSLILMIVARCVDPKNVLAKILMWVYISLILLACLLFFVTCLTLFLSCVTLAQSCPG